FVLFFLFLNRVAWVKGDIGYVLFIVALIGAFIVQSWLFRHKIEYVTAINLRLSSAVRKAAIIIVAVLLLLGMNIFIYFHGWALFILVLGEKVFIRVFSSDVGLSFLMFSIANALAFIVLLGGFLYGDVSKRRNLVFVLPLFCYLAIFSIYTLNASPRYYLSLLVVLMVYLAIKLAIVLEGSRYFGIVLAALLAGFCISHGLVWSASFKTGGFQPKIFKFGRKGVENSAHFLPMWPIVDSLLTRNVGHFESSKSHFIMGPISFYKYIY